MKNYLLTILLFASTTLMAQQLTSDNVPLRGEQKVYYLLDEGASNFEAITGFGSTWDYSGVAATGETSLGKVVYASEADFGDAYHQYSSATVFEGVATIFSVVNDGTQYANGLVFNDPAYGPAVASFNVPTAMYSFPFSQDNGALSVALAGNFAVTTNSGDIDGPFTGSITNEVDGSGSLVLAGITYSNVIRLSQVVEMEMQAFGETVILKSEQYSYFNHEVGNLPLFMHSHVMYKFENEADPINEYTYVLSSINPDQGAIVGDAFTAANAPSIGDSQTMFAVNAESADALEGVTGNGVTWDYTGIYGYDGLEKEFAVTAANSATYPDATMALEYDDLATMYISQNDYGYRVHGMDGDGGSQGTGSAKLSTPTQMFNFPFGYGSGAYFSGFGGTADFENDNHSVTDAPMLGSIFTEVDGVGTLNLPHTSYENVVRFKFIDTVYVDAHGYADDMLQTTVQYAYFDFSTSNLPIFTHTYIMFKWVGSASVIREETRVFSIDDPDLILCDANNVPDLQLVEATTNQAEISWDAMPGEAPAWYAIQYRKVGDDTWTTVSANGSATSRTLYYLESGTEYEVQMKVYCTPTNQSGDWGASLFFTTVAEDVDEDAENCFLVPVLSVDNVTHNSAVLSWETINGVNWFEFRYRKVGADAWTNTSTSGSNSSKTLYALANNTEYEVQAKTLCSINESSEWGESVFFNTGVNNCQTAPELSVGEVGVNTGTVEWDAISGVNWFEFRYRVVGDTDWMNTSSSASHTSKTFYSLESNTTYEVQAKTMCSISNNSGWGASVEFTTGEEEVPSPSCSQVPSLSLQDIGETIATITWDEYTEAPGWYEFRYRVVGTEEWTIATSGGDKTNRTYYYLQSGTSYETQARVFCLGQEGSDWSEVLNFTTLGDQGLVKGDDDYTNDVAKTNVVTTTEVVMYPNPTADVLNINVVLNDANGNLSVNVFDLSGRIVASQDMSAYEGLNTVRISLGNLTSGMYSVVVSQDNVVINRSKVQKN